MYWQYLLCLKYLKVFMYYMYCKVIEVCMFVCFKVHKLFQRYEVVEGFIIFELHKDFYSLMYLK